MFNDLYLKTSYYKKHATISHGNDTYSNEHLSFYTKDDVTSILNAAGINLIIKEILGKFFIDGDDNIR